MYYPSSENKVADQLRGYREADLRLCFRMCKKPVFSRRGSNVFRVGVSCRNLYSFVVYLYVNGSGSITSAGEERAHLSAVVYL